MRRRLLLSVGTVIGAIALLAAPASSLGAEPPASFAAPIKTQMTGSEHLLSGALATADFNADGRDDAVAYAGNFETHEQTLQTAISEVASDGSKRWNWHPLASPSVTDFYGGAVVAANVNPGSDGSPDVVALAESEDEGGSVLAVYLNSGSGIFAAPIETSIPGYAGGLAVGDVNDDGIPDVVIPTVVEMPTGGWRAEVVTLLGLDNGEFESQIESPIGEAAGPFEIEFGGTVIGDFTGSGHADIAVSRAYDAEHDAYVMSGDGTGHFAVRSELGLGAAYDLAGGDFDGDGHEDLALAIGGPESSNHEIAEMRIATALGNGAGSFTSLLPEEPHWQGENPYSYTIRTADLNGDGRPDLVAPIASDGYHGGVWALLGNGDGTFSTVDREGLESDDVWAAEAGDFSGDGRSDDIAALVWPDGGSLELAIYENTSEPALALGASSLDLGTTEVGQATTAPLAITNSGNYGLSVSSLAVGGADAGDFSVSGCSGAPIAPGATCEARVSFAPTLAGSRSATLTIASDDPTQPNTTLALGGIGSPSLTGGGSGPSGGGPGTSGGGGGPSSGGGDKSSSGSTNGTPAGATTKAGKGEAAPEAVGKLTVAKTATVSKSGVATLKLSCGGGTCGGKLALSATVKKKKGKSKAATLKLGAASYAVGAGKTRTATVKLSAAGRAALAAAPSHMLRATIAITPNAGAKSTAKVTLVAAKPTKKKVT